MFVKRFYRLCLLGLPALMFGNASAQQKAYSWNNLPRAVRPVFKTDTFNITKYGAKSDGVTLNTQSISKAIADCSAHGGGVVLIPAGFWLTGPVELKSNVNLHVNRSALLQFTDDKTQYPLVAGNYEGHLSPRNQSPISGTDLINIAITGDGVIDGGGEVWRAMGKSYASDQEWKALIASGGVLSEDGKAWYPSESYRKGMSTKESIYLKPGQPLSDFESMKDFFRPNMVVLTNCKKVLLQDATFENSPAWCLHPLLCEDLTLDGVHVRNAWNAQNGDGIDVESCRNVVIENSTFDCGDDGICVKSGRDEEGRKRGKPTENMLVRNNVVYRAHGGFVIGSEMSGGAKNIFVSNCSFIGTDNGLRFKTTRGRGGVVEQIYIKDIAMRDIAGNAILFDMYYMQKPGAIVKQPVTEATPQFKDFYVSNVFCNGATLGLLIRGLPEMAIKGIHLDNVILKTTNGAEITEAQDITLSNITFQSSKTKPVIAIDNSSNIAFDTLKYTDGAEQLFSISGERSGSINVKHTDLSQAHKDATFAAGVDTKVLSIIK